MENSPSPASVEFRRQSHSLANLLSGLVIFGTLFAGAFAFICLQDDIKGYDFQISDTLKPYVQKLHLTEKASKTLLATHPALQEKQAFNQSCHSHNHEVYVLGCYVHDDDRIYLYHVESNDLPGVIEVTTAHEMLHAAYQRVPFWEIDRLNEEIKKAYDNLPPDHEIRTSIKSYSEDDFYDELHSRLGTEVADLSDFLEKHYAAYFQHRQTITDFNQQYHSVFQKLNDKLTSLKSEIDAKQTAINQQTEAYNNETNALNQLILDFNQRVESGSISGWRYQNERATLEARIGRHEATYQSIQQAIDAINQQIAEYNNHVLFENQLMNQINSNAVSNELESQK